MRVPPTLGDPALPELVVPVAAQRPEEVLATGLRSGDPSVRARAVALRIGLGDDEVARRAVGDEWEWVRTSAVDALASRGDEEAERILVGVACDPAADPYLRGRTALLAPSPASQAAMVAAMHAAPDPFQAAPFALAALRLGAAEARPVLERSLVQGALPLDLGFVWELAESADPELVAPLTRAAERVEPELVLPLVVVRLALGDPAADAELRRELATGDEGVRLEIVDHLVQVNGQAAIALLRRAVDLGPELIARYAELVLAARGEADLRSFARAMADGDRELRQLAMQLAARVRGDRRTLREMEAAVGAGLSDRDAKTRALAARTAGDLGLSPLRGPLTAALTDESELVRVEAAGALLRLPSS